MFLSVETMYTFFFIEICYDLIKNLVLEMTGTGFHHTIWTMAHINILGIRTQVTMSFLRTKRVLGYYLLIMVRL